MKKFFEPSDFPVVISGDYPLPKDVRDNLSRLCNAKIEKLMSEWPRIYKYKGSEYADWSREIDEDFGGVKKYDLQGYVAFIEPLMPQRDEEPKEEK